MTELERLKKAIFELRSKGLLKKQDDIAQKTGYNKSSISEILNGKVPLSEKFIKVFCSEFGVNSDYIIKGGELNIRLGEAVQIFPNIMMVPFVHQYAYAGYLCGFDDNGYMETLPKIPFIVDHEAKGDYISFEVKGESMFDGTENSYIEGDKVLCREIKKEYWKSKLHFKNWDFLIVHRTDGITVKQIIDHDVENGVITTHSINPEYEDQKIDLKDVVKLFYVIESLRSRKH